jgi:hypothetical protein
MQIARPLGNAERVINIGFRQLMRVPRHLLCLARLPSRVVAGSRVERFELASGGRGLVGFELLLQHGDDRIIPGVMQILFYRRDVDPLARSAPDRRSLSYAELMDVEMNEKGKVAGGTPFVVIPIAKALRGVLVDFPTSHNSRPRDNRIVPVILQQAQSLIEPRIRCTPAALIREKIVASRIALANCRLLPSQ